MRWGGVALKGGRRGEGVPESSTQPSGTLQFSCCNMTTPTWGGRSSREAENSSTMIRLNVRYVMGRRVRQGKVDAFWDADGVLRELRARERGKEMVNRRRWGCRE